MYWLTGLLGLAFVAAPLLFNFTGDIAALWTSIILGGAVVVLSVIEGLRGDRDFWEYSFVALLGVGAIGAPFLFGFSGIPAAMWTSSVIGLLVMVVAIYKLYYDQRTSW